MANSKYEYTRLYEHSDRLLPNTWIVVRIDGRGFHRFTTLHEFSKPNDIRALELMNACAAAVLRSLTDIVVAYGQSDEYSFVFHPSTALFERRESKLISTIVSLFTACYVHYWPEKFPASPLTSQMLPTFDARAVLYPSLKEIRDYLSWRQADCHINNLYNTTFWALVNRGGLSMQDAKEKLDGSLAADKNEILFSQFGINYNNEPEIFRKGSVLFRDVERRKYQTELAASEEGSSEHRLEEVKESKRQLERDRKRKAKATIAVEHLDIIKDEFWELRPWVLEGKLPQSTSASADAVTNATADAHAERTK